MARSVTVSTTIPEEMRIKLENLAAQEDRKLSWIIRKAVEEYLKKQEK